MNLGADIVFPSNPMSLMKKYLCVIKETLMCESNRYSTTCPCFSMRHETAVLEQMSMISRPSLCIMDLGQYCTVSFIDIDISLPCRFLIKNIMSYIYLSGKKLILKNIEIYCSHLSEYYF